MIVIGRPALRRLSRERRGIVESDISQGDSHDRTL